MSNVMPVSEYESLDGVSEPTAPIRLLNRGVVGVVVQPPTHSRPTQQCVLNICHIGHLESSS